jgi:hypothetical protein
MDGGAEVVMEAWQGEVHCADRAADGGLGFKELDVEARLGKDDGGGQAVGAGSDDVGFAAGVGWLRHNRFYSVLRSEVD